LERYFIQIYIMFSLLFRNSIEGKFYLISLNPIFLENIELSIIPFLRSA